MEKDVSDLNDFKDPSMGQVHHASSLDPQSKCHKSQATYFQSTMEKSPAEALVLNYAAAFPHLEPAKTIVIEGGAKGISTPQVKEIQAKEIQAKEINEKKEQEIKAGLSPLTYTSFVHTTSPLRQPKKSRMSSHAFFKKDKKARVQDIARLAEHLLILLLRQVKQNLSEQDQGSLLTLSALTLNMLDLTAYGEMPSEKQKQHLSTLLEQKTLFEHENKQIETTALSLIAFIRAHLPADEQKRKEATLHLFQTIEATPSFESLFQNIQHLLASPSFLSKEGDVSAKEIHSLLNNLTLQEPQPAEQAIIHTIWQTYNNNFDQFTQRMQVQDVQTWIKEQSGKAMQSATQYYALILAQTATQNEGKGTLRERFLEAFDQWIADPNQKIEKTSSSTDYPHSSFITGCMVCGVDLIKENTKEASAFQQEVKSSPIADVLFAAAPLLTLPIDYQAAAALIAALLNNGVVYKATEDALEKGKTQNTPLHDLDFAIEYAKQIIAIVIHQKTASSLRQKEGDKQSKEIEERDRLICLMLSVMALNLLYRAAYGGMTGEEFGSILKGETADIHEKIKPIIEQLAQLILSSLPQGEKMRTETIIKLMDYIDTKDSINSILQSTRVLVNALSPAKDLDQKRWEMQSG